MKIRPPLLASVLALCAFSGNPLQAQTHTWSQTAVGALYDWALPANWGGAGFPGVAGDIANLNINILGAQTVRLQQAITLGTLNFGDSDGSHTMAISSGTGTNVLTFQSAVAGGDTFLNVMGGLAVVNTISANIALGGTSSLKWTAGTQQLTQSGIFSTNGNNITLTGGTPNVPSWNVNGDLVGGGTITYNGLGGINIGGTGKSFTGTFVLNRGVSGSSNAGTLTVTGGSIANAAEVVINGYLSGTGVVQNGGSLHSGNQSASGTNPGQRLTLNTIRLNGGSLNAAGQTALADGLTPWKSAQELVQDTVNVLDFDSGYSLLGAGASATTAGTRLNITTLERSIGASAFVRGATVGTTARILIGNASSFLVGANGLEGSQTMSIIPWMGVNDTTSGTTVPIGFATYTANGIRALTVAGEYSTSITAGSTANVSTSVVGISSPTTINSLRFTANSAVNLGAGQVLTITSGGLFLTSNLGGLGQPGNAAAGSVAFGSAEGVIWANGTNINTIGASISGSKGLTKAGTGTLDLAGSNTYTGNTIVGAGTLLLSGSISGSTGVQVTNGGTMLLGANGANRIGDTTPVTLSGGTFGLASNATGVSEGSGSAVGIGALTLSATSTIDFGASTAGTLNFASFAPGLFTLNITNYSSLAAGQTVFPGTDGADDRLIFATDQAGNLARFSFGGSAAAEITFMSGATTFYEVVPVPEPSALWMGAAGIGLIAWRERRRIQPA